MNHVQLVEHWSNITQAVPSASKISVRFLIIFKLDVSYSKSGRVCSSHNIIGCQEQVRRSKWPILIQGLLLPMHKHLLLLDTLHGVDA
jgi:hypothetical protein